MRRIWLFLPLVLALALGVVFYAGLGKDPSKLESARIGQNVPAFELSLLRESEQWVGPEVLKGETVLLNVWATWCPSCRQEHPYLNELAEKGVPLVGLNYKDERESALGWLSDLGDPYRFNIYDPEGSLGFDLGVYGSPETYLIDGDGIVRYRHVGVVNERVWENELKPLYEQYAEES